MRTVPKIVCPSRGRAGRVTTQNAITNLILCVSETQAEAYRQAHPDIEVVEHPEELEKPGPIARKYNWMMDHFGDHFVLDDDLKWMLSCCRGPGEGNGRLTPEEAYAVVLNTHEMAEDLDAKLYGYSLYSDIRNYFGLRPFRFTGIAWNCGMGFRVSAKDYKLRYPLDLRTHEDYGICLLNMYYYRYMLVDERFAWLGATFSNTGGAAEYRTQAYEMEAANRLREMFGPHIVQWKEDKPRAKRKHPAQITIKPPF